MNEIRSAQLLDSVVNITAESNRDHFRRSLSGTVRELLKVDDVSFLRPGPENDGEISFQELYYEAAGRRISSTEAPEHRPGLRPEQLARLLRRGHCLEVEEGRATLMLPVLVREALSEVVVLRAPAIPPSMLTMLRGFVRLYRNFIALIDESERDPLTGLLNRRVLETRMSEVARERARIRSAAPGPSGDDRRRSPRTGSHFIAVLDIDHFKRINDTLGHLYGDEVILLVAQLMREVFRDDDMIFRYGGEEFVVIIAADNLGHALSAVERCRERIASRSFPQLRQVTVSGGVAEMHGFELPSAAVARADKALYCAKDDGRNRIYTFEYLQASGRFTAITENHDVELF